MNKQPQQTTDNTQKGGPVINRRARRAMQRSKRGSKKKLVPDGAVTTDETKVVYKDDSYIDKTKKVFSHGMKYVKERLRAKNEKHDLPEHITTVRRGLRTTCLIINKDGRERSFLPDVKPKHKILVHRNIAKVLISDVCMLVRITRNHSQEDDSWIDGSWAITPAEWRMMNATTIQHLKLRKWFFLRRYWYEISFDGRVQPAHLLYDYEMDPAQRKTRLWVTREYVPVAKTDKFNDYFRFWKNKPDKK